MSTETPTPAADKTIALGHPSYVWRFGQDRRLDLIRTHAPLTGKRVLDVGCGLGMYVRKMSAFAAEVHGVDIDAEKVAEASQTLPNIHVAPAEKLPFSDDFFDVVLSHEVIEHVADDRQAIHEAYRVTRPGGRVVVFAPNRLYIFETHGVYVGGRYIYRLAPFVNWLPDGLRNRFAPHVRAYRSDDLRRLFAGLPGRWIAFTQIYPGYDKIASRRRQMARLLRGVTYTLEHTPLRRFGLSHFAVYEKAGPPS